MRKQVIWAGATATALCAALAATLVACSTAPTALESKFFDIETNLVADVATAPHVVPRYSTNISEMLVTNRTADGEALVVPMTNATVEVTFVTNHTVASNVVVSYTYKPNTNAAQLQAVGSRTAGLFGPFGELVGVLIGAGFGLWGYLRSSKAAKVAGVLAQVIETGRMVLQATPQGQALDEEWKRWMIQHQAEQGVIQDVVKLLGNVVDEPSAKQAAERLLALMQERRGEVISNQ